MAGHFLDARPRVRRLLAGAAVVTALGLLSAAAPPHAAARDDGHGGRSYLALGDSVPFGYITQAGFEYGNPTNFVGFPERVGALRNLEVVNASCPGQTSSSLIDQSASDNGCTGFRAIAPLHVTYQGSQLAFATQWLRGHLDARAVSLLVGANDAFILQKQCAAAVNPPLCVVQGLPALTHTIATNLDTIYAALRSTGYEGHIVAVTYYALDYSDLQAVALAGVLNKVITDSAHAHGALVADAFATFQAATATQFAKGSSCRAGLLNAAPQNQFLCDVHPSQSGQALLARTVSDALGAAGDD